VEVSPKWPEKWNEVEQERWNKSQSETSLGVRGRRRGSASRAKVEQVERKAAFLFQGLFHLKLTQKFPGTLIYK